MSKLFLFTLFFCKLASVQAEEYGFSFGSTLSNLPSFRGGIITSIFFNNSLKLRSGILFSQRKFSVDVAGTGYTYNWRDLDVPVLFQFNFSKGSGVFAGSHLSFNLDRSASPSLVLRDAPGLIIYGVLGLNFIFDNMYGFDVGIESTMSPVEQNISTLTLLTATFVYYFL